MVKIYTVALMTVGRIPPHQFKLLINFETIVRENLKMFKNKDILSDFSGENKTPNLHLILL